LENGAAETTPVSPERPDKMERSRSLSVVDEGMYGRAAVDREVVVGREGRIAKWVVVGSSHRHRIVDK